MELATFGEGNQVPEAVGIDGFSLQDLGNTRQMSVFVCVCTPSCAFILEFSFLLRQGCWPPHLHVAAASHLGEVLLVLQGFVDLVVRHAEAAQTRLDGIVGLCEDDELGHVRDADDFTVNLGGEVDGLLDLSTVDEPETAAKEGSQVFDGRRRHIQRVTGALLPCRHIGGERHAVLDECQRGRSCYILPLRWGGPT